MSDPGLQTAAEIQRRVAARELSPVEVVNECLARVERLDGELNALPTRSERAVEEARDLEERLAAGETPGPLCGVPVGIKDVTPVAGLRTTYGSPLYADHVPTEDALVVRRLRAAGAIVLGKTNTPEFAAGGHTRNELFGVTRNPWNPSRSAGGSTGGGAAALAVGMIAVAEGTDLGGSLRLPAAFCGVVGLRPSPGLVPTWPTPWGWDTLQVSGPMARTAEDAALALQAMAGATPLSPLAAPDGKRDFVGAVRAAGWRGKRLAWAPDPARIGVDPSLTEVCRRAAAAAAREGSEVEEVNLDLGFAREAFLTLRGVWMVVHQRERLERLERLGANVRGNVEVGLALSPADLARAEGERDRVWRVLGELLARFDAVLTPCTAVPPFPAEWEYPREIAGRPMQNYAEWLAPTSVLSLAGLPVASVPAGLDPDGLPVGLQIVGPPHGEETVLALAGLFGEASPLGPPPLARPGA